ncbi:hypothetical protein ABTI69_20410, partial [Acinetobacter baumannii]
MLRLTEIKLPLDHPEEALRAAVLERLRIADADLLSVHVFRRGYDARRRSAIHLIYTLDVELRDEAAVLRAQKPSPHLQPTPDTQYRF